jgi:hypothetical protein
MKQSGKRVLAGFLILGILFNTLYFNFALAANNTRKIKLA